MTQRDQAESKMDFGCVLIQFTAYRLQRGRRPPRRTHAASLRAPRSTFAAAPDPRAGLSQGVRSRGAVKLRGVPRGPQGRADGPAGCRRAIPRRGLFRRHGTLQRQLCRGGLFQDLLRVFSGSVWPTGRAGLGAPEVRSVVYSGGLGCPSSSHTVNQDSPSLWQDIFAGHPAGKGLQDVRRVGQSGAEGVEERGSWAVCEASLGAKPGSNGILDHPRHALCPLASTISSCTLGAPPLPCPEPPHMVSVRELLLALLYRLHLA